MGGSLTVFVTGLLSFEFQECEHHNDREIRFSTEPFYKYECAYPLHSDTQKEIDRHIGNFLEALTYGDSKLGWTEHASSSVAVTQNALASYLAYTVGEEIMKQEEPLDRFAAAYRKASMLGYLSSPHFHTRFKKKLKGHPEKIKYFPPALWWDFFSLLGQHRDKALFLLMVGTSARIGQALNVWQKDILFDEKRVVFEGPLTEARERELKDKYGLDPDPGINSKGELPGVWLPGLFKEEFFKQARSYYEKEYVPVGKRPKPHPYFFVTKTGRRLVPQQVRHKFSITLGRLGITDLTPHSLRHLYGYVCAAHLQLPVERIADNMGHRTIESTRVYTRIPSGEQEEIFRSKLKDLLLRTKEGRRKERMTC